MNMLKGIAKRLTLFVFSLLVASTALFAQKTDIAQVKRDIAASTKDKQTLVCDFVITKRSKMLKDAAVMTGKMAYKKPYQIYWECTSPSKIVFTSDGTQATVEKNGEKKTVDLKSDKVFKRIKKMTTQGIGIESLVESDKFDATLSESDTEWIITMTPNRKELEQFASKIVLHADKMNHVIKTIELTAKNGDSTTIELRNVKTNANTDAIFSRN